MVLPEDFFNISETDLIGYPCTEEIREEISITIREADNHSLAPVIKLSDNCYAVYGRPTASNPLGFCHVKRKVDEGHLVCCGKDCHGTVSKAKQVRVKAICPHLHMLKCALNLKLDDEFASQEMQDVGSPATVPVDVIPDVAPNEQGIESTSRKLSVKLALSRKISYNVGKDMLEKISKMDANSFLGLVDKGWPEEFIPNNTERQLCNSVLSSAMTHLGQKGKSYLLTELNPFKSISIRVKMCRNSKCKAMHQPLLYDIGK